MTATFGLDFGTTNSLITVIRKEEGRDVPEPLMLDNQPHPSVVWYPGGDPVCGREAKKQLTELGLGVFGDIVRSPKMYLGKTTGIHVGGLSKPATDVVADMLKFLRKDASDRGLSNDFRSAIVTIPVAMDGRARAELRQAARKAGFKIYQFIHEPLAALYGYLRGQDNSRARLAALEGRYMLVFDWGGGTIDLTLCQLRDGVLTQLLNSGDRETGGDKFDKRLRALIRKKHEQQYPSVDWMRLQPTAESRLIEDCEIAKIALSSRPSTVVDRPDILASPGPEKNISLKLERGEMEDAVRDLIQQGLKRIDSLLESAGLSRDNVEFCLVTGGMAAMPAIQNGLRELFGARLEIAKNGASVISEGAAWIAHDKVTLELAKPIEILTAADSYIKLFQAGDNLPTAGQEISKKMDMYAVDPSDGFAKFVFARPKWLGRNAHGDERIPYAHLTLPIDPYGKPLMERLHVDATINDDLVVNIEAMSSLREESCKETIFDLEFGLRILE